MRQLKFPPYEYLKSLPVTEEGSDVPAEYRYILFTTPTTVHGRLSYNEDGSGCIFFDVLEYGYVEVNNFGMALKLNKANYTKICKHAQKVFEDFYRELDIDYSEQWEKYCDKEN